MTKDVLGFDDKVMVMFENNEEEQVTVIKGHPLAVKSAILTLMLHLAKEEEMSVIELLQEFVEVATIKEQYEELDAIMEHLGIERE